VTLLLSYGGEEYLYTSLVVTDSEGHPNRSEIGSHTTHTGYQMRRALARHPDALRKALRAEQT